METTNNVIEMTKGYTLRKLEARDIAPMASILSKIGIKELKNCINGSDIQQILSGKAVQAEAVGMAVAFDFVGVILANYEKTQNDIFKLLASLSGKTEKQIESLPLADFTEMIVDVVKKEEFKDFIKVVSKLFK